MLIYCLLFIIIIIIMARAVGRMRHEIDAADKRGSDRREHAGHARARQGNNFLISNKAATAANGSFRESTARRSVVNSRAGYARQQDKRERVASAAKVKIRREGEPSGLRARRGC